MKRSSIRKLEESSWLAQTLADRMSVEYNANGITSRYNCYAAFKSIVNKADSNESGFRYDNYNGKRQIIISYIPTDLVNILTGMSVRYTDDNGMPIISVLTTHDLNSATINDIGELLYQMSV